MLLLMVVDRELIIDERVSLPLGDLQYACDIFLQNTDTRICKMGVSVGLTSGTKLDHDTVSTGFQVVNPADIGVFPHQETQAGTYVRVRKTDRPAPFVVSRHRGDHQIHAAGFQGDDETVESNIFNLQRSPQTFGECPRHLHTDTGRRTVRFDHFKRWIGQFHPDPQGFHLRRNGGVLLIFITTTGQR